MPPIVSSACPFATLGVVPGASVDEIRSAFRRAALRTHPDKIGGSSAAFTAVHQAYEALGQVDKGWTTGCSQFAWSGFGACESSPGADWNAAPPSIRGAVPASIRGARPRSMWIAS